MQPDFATLKPVDAQTTAPSSSGDQPDFATLKPISVTSSPTTPAQSIGQSTSLAPVLKDAVSGLGSDFQGRANAIADVFKTGFQGKVLNPGEILTGGAKIAAEATGGITDVFSRGLKALTDTISLDPDLQRIASTKGVMGVLDAIANAKNGVTASAQPVMDKLNTWSQAHPEVSSFISSIGKTALNVAPFAVGPEASVAAKDIAAGTANRILPGSAVDSSAALEKLALGPEAKIAERHVQTAIDAVNPNLSGKNLVTAYKQTVSGAREITPSSMFREQGLTPEKQTINLGKRLTSDISLSDGTSVKGVQFNASPVKNLDSLGSALEDTENKLTAALKGDMEVNYNANKPGLVTKLNNLNTQMPREFTAIKDSKSVFSNVVDFAKNVIKKSDDSITGIRDARTAFDAQARTEYPSAFKNGSIDTKTPAGRAIKLVRDTMNEHLYNTAPNGSDIQTLIGREADIFRAADSVAPKAAAGEGKNAIQQFIQRHPTLSKYLKGGAIAVGADAAIKRITGVGI